MEFWTIIIWIKPFSMISGVGSNRVLGGPPIQVEGVALIIKFVTTIIYLLHKGHIIVIKNFGERLIHNENCKIAYVKEYALSLIIGGGGGGGAVAPLATLVPTRLDQFQLSKSVCTCSDPSEKDHKLCINTIL